MEKTTNNRKVSRSDTGADTVIAGLSLFTEQDIYLFKEGNHFNLFDKMGAHRMEHDGAEGVYFAVSAPNAEQVNIIGDFNFWDKHSHKLAPRWDGSGIWEGFVPGLKKGTTYKYHIISKNGYSVDKCDPYAYHCEEPPKTASIVWDLDYEWSDSAWMQHRSGKNALDAPMSIYEVHLGSWKRVPQEGNRPLSYREMAVELADYVKEMGFTHVELMPVMEHPFYGSWGYQICGYFAPTSRYGTPQDFMYMIDHLHQNGIGVLLDWVPSHFPSDDFGLSYFDGTHLYEHADPRQGFHPDWKSHIFNYGRREVRNFLISNAFFWLKKFHIDGLRVDAVASMLYLDYSREEGEWVPNRYGGRENIEAIEFMKQLNHVLYEEFPGVQLIAEESTAWPMVTRPTYVGGLGFGYKWNMGWMHDTLKYFSEDPVHRKYHHDELTFSLLYAFNENFILPLSHDEVVHGKGSILAKMPGDPWQKFANLRALLGLMFTHPGKKLLFMGIEIGQWDEWAHDSSLDWHLLQFDPHKKLQKWVKDLNNFYRKDTSLHEKDFTHEGFRWVDCSNNNESVISFLRKGKDPKDQTLVICNLTPVPRHQYRLGVPFDGLWKEVLNSDAEEYGGSGVGNCGQVRPTPVPYHGFYDSVSLTLPPLGVLVLKPER